MCLLFYQLKRIVQRSFIHTNICLQAPIRSSRNPTCSLRESMRSSCCRECDRKLVLSGRKLLVSPTPSKGKSVVKGARTISSFYRKEGIFTFEDTEIITLQMRIWFHTVALTIDKLTMNNTSMAFINRINVNFNIYINKDQKML